MYNNIIYFIIVLLIFNIAYPDSSTENSLNYTLLMLFLSWVAFAGCCWGGFQRILGRFKEDDVGRGVVQEAAQDAGGPEELGGGVDPQAGALDVQDLDGHLHADEDADEQAGDLQDGYVVEVVVPADALGRQQQ